MKLKWFAGVCMILVMAFSLSACRSSQIVYEPDRVPLPAGAGKLSQETLDEIVMTASTRRGWVFTQEAPGKLKGDLQRNFGKSVQVMVTINPQNYSINYLGSTQVETDGKYIDYNYNRWVRYLESDIKQAIAQSVH